MAPECKAPRVVESPATAGPSDTPDPLSEADAVGDFVECDPLRRFDLWSLYTYGYAYGRAQRERLTILSPA